MDKLHQKLDDYYNQFPLRWETQKYLWKSVQTFQNKWYLNAAILADMIDESTADADYILDSEGYHPRKMLRSMIEVDRQKVMQMFERLFDESKDVVKRFYEFEIMSEIIRIENRDRRYLVRYDSAMYPVAVSTFLWLMYPDRYYFYKYAVAKKVSFETGIEFTDSSDRGDKIASWFSILDQVSESLRQETRFRKLLDERLDETMYEDNQMHCMAIDFAFFIRPLYDGRKKRD